MIALPRVAIRINDDVRAVKFFPNLDNCLVLFYEFLLYVFSGNRSQWVRRMDLLKIAIISNGLAFFCFVCFNLSVKIIDILLILYIST